jgi:transcriptional regulator with XRE-family HTH domain
MAKQIFNAKKIGNKIREKRIALNLTQLELGNAVKCTEVYICNIENGDHLPSNKLMKKIFDKLGIVVTVKVE